VQITPPALRELSNPGSRLLWAVNKGVMTRKASPSPIEPTTPTCRRGLVTLPLRGSRQGGKGTFEVATVDDAVDHDSRRVREVEHPPVAHPQSVPSTMTSYGLDIGTWTLVGQGVQSLEYREPLFVRDATEVAFPPGGEGYRPRQGSSLGVELGNHLIQ